jgi:hypothetical protein
VTHKSSPKKEVFVAAFLLFFISWTDQKKLVFIGRKKIANPRILTLKKSSIINKSRQRRKSLEQFPQKTKIGTKKVNVEKKNY